MVRQTLAGSHNEQRLDNSKTIDVYAIIEGCSNVPQFCYVLRLLAVLESTDRGAVNRYKRSPPYGSLQGLIKKTRTSPEL